MSPVPQMLTLAVNFWGGVVIIRCSDPQTGDAFAANVPKSRALAAFDHPTAYRRSCRPSDSHSID
jgi:hypothetical protein